LGVADAAVRLAEADPLHRTEGLRIEGKRARRIPAAEVGGQRVGRRARLAHLDSILPQPPARPSRARPITSAPTRSTLSIQAGSAGRNTSSSAFWMRRPASESGSPRAWSQLSARSAQNTRLGS